MYSYSPEEVSKVPCCRLMSLIVNRGPISCKFAFAPSSSKMYRWWRKKMKSRWLCNVITRLPMNSGLWGNKAANMRPMRCPSRVSKLFKMISGKWWVGFAWWWISLFNTTFVILNVAVGPFGKWLIIRLAIMVTLLFNTRFIGTIAEYEHIRKPAFYCPSYDLLYLWTNPKCRTYLEVLAWIVIKFWNSLLELF